MENELVPNPIHILLADDDLDDCFFFIKALKEITIPTHLTTVNDGEQLMSYLNKYSNILPDILFLDLSMPRKTGFECLTEIKESKQLKNLYVVMLSTSFPRDNNYEQEIIKVLYTIGAQDFIRKPSEFQKLKEVIQSAIIKMKELKITSNS